MCSISSRSCAPNSRRGRSPPRELLLGIVARGIALFTQPHRDMAVLLREAEIAVGKAAIANEFLEGAPFMTLPIRIVEILVEHDDAARLQPWRQFAEHGRCRGIDVAIDVEERDHVTRIGSEKRRQGLLEPALVERDIRRNFGQGAAAAEFSLALEGAGPVLG